MRYRISFRCITLSIVVCIQVLGSVANGDNASLSALYPREKLQKILIPRGEWRPFASAKDRPAWAAISGPIREKFITLGEEFLGKDVPNLPATLYLEYRRIGNRSNYQGVWLERRKMLHCLVLAECMEGKGRFLDAIANVVWEIGRFIYRAHISSDYFANIGDCDARLDIDRDTIFRYGRRIKDEKMQSFATFGVTEQGSFASEKSFRSLGRMLHELFNLPNLLAAGVSAEPLVRDVWLGHEDMQLMAARDKEGSSEGLYVACWASHNGQSHNHNDVGNFIIFADGRPFIIDIGRPTYTRQTFSSRRYEIPEMQSAFHNLPTINGVMQQAGRRYAAKDVQYTLNEDGARLKMDIAPAYPDKAGVKTWVRTVSLNRTRDVQVEDSFSLKQPSQNITQNLITPCEVIRNDPGRLILKDSAGSIKLGVQYDSDILAAQVESIPPADEKLARIWGPHMYRILLRPRSATRIATWTLRFSK